MLDNAITFTLGAGRSAFRARMRGTCVIRRYGERTTDADGRVTAPSTVIYPDPAWPADHPDKGGPCYTRYPGMAFEQNFESAGATVVESRVVVRIPFGAVIRPYDEIEIITDPDNPQLAGTKYQVASIDDQSQGTAQRLLCRDRQAGVTP